MNISKTKEEIKSIETQFKQNEYYGDPSIETFTFKEGNIPIILTAPHSVKTLKRDKSTGKIVVKANESYVGTIALILNETIGCHVMVRNNNNEGNRENNFFNQELIDYINDLGIFYHIDLIGVKDSNPYDIGVGTNNGIYMKNLINYEKIMIKAFEIHGITNLSFTTKLQATNKATLCRQVYDNCCISTTQLAINKSLRAPVTDIERMNTLLSGLATYIEGIAEEKNFNEQVYRYRRI